MGQSLAVQYRPTSLDEVVGQEQAKTVLSNILNGGRLPAAILITGETGCGKTTLSRIVGRTLNCAKPKKGVACGKCPSCQMFDSSPDDHPDWQETNAATERGIEDARSLVGLAKYHPTYNVRCIMMDEVHQLTPQAAQALLKALEEPKEHTLWILATTNPEKLLPTIINRCVHLKLTPVESEVMAPRLKFIAKECGVKLTDEQSTMLAEYSGGFVRQAIANLEEIVNVVQAKPKANVEKLIENIFQNSDEMELTTIGMGMLIYMYEGKKAPLLSMISQVKDWPKLVNQLSYMNGYLMYTIMQKMDSSTVNPFFGSYANKTLVGALSEYINDKELRVSVLSNAIKASHKLFTLREGMFSTSFPDKVTLAITYLIDEPTEFVKIGVEPKDAKGSKSGKSGKDKKKKKK